MHGEGSGGGSRAEVPVFISGGYNAAGQGKKENTCKLQVYGGAEMDFLQVFYVNVRIVVAHVSPPSDGFSPHPLSQGGPAQLQVTIL